MQKILVTGGAGFIGSNFVRYLLKQEQDLKIYNLDSLTYAGNIESILDCMENPRHIFIRGNINDTNLIEKIISENDINGIINFAAESHVDRSIEGPALFAKTNVLGTLTLLQSAKKHKLKILHISTDEVYGSLGSEGKFSETTPLSPNSPYSASKAGADHMVHAFHHTYGLHTIITRCSNNYGPYQFPEKMIPLCIKNAIENKNIPVYGDGLQIRDWLYVEDHCSSVWSAYTKGKAGEVYNVGGSNEMCNLDLVKTILKLLGRDEKLITFVKDRPGHDRRYAIDSSKIRNELGWKPSVNFEEGIKKTVEWYLSNKSWLSHVSSGEYQNYYKKMYDKR